MDDSLMRTMTTRLRMMASNHRLRMLRRVEGCGVRIRVDGQEVLLFCGNDYLGLRDHAEIRRRIEHALRSSPLGAGASMLVSGNHPEHIDAENRMAEFTGTAEARLFATGYQANVGALSCLAGEDDVIFSDEKNHASLIDGARLSRARVVVYRHVDLEDLERKLCSTPAQGLRFIVSDALFSMDGDLAPIEGLVDMARCHDATIYLDEAHSMGILGPSGKGLAARAGLSDAVGLKLATLGKAFGLFGAVVCGSSEAIQWLTGTARSLLYSTAMPPYLAAAVVAAVDLVEAADDRRARLDALVSLFRKESRDKGLRVLDSITPIQPVIIGHAGDAIKASEAMLEQGYFVQAFRPPTVPEGSSRLRITITAAHSEEQVQGLVHALASVPGTR